MAPRTRGRQTTAAETAAVGTYTDISTQPVSKKGKGKGKGTKMHPSLPPLVIKRPRGETSEGKHCLER